MSLRLKQLYKISEESTFVTMDGDNSLRKSKIMLEAKLAKIDAKKSRLLENHQTVMPRLSADSDY